MKKSLFFVFLLGFLLIPFSSVYSSNEQQVDPSSQQVDSSSQQVGPKTPTTTPSTKSFQLENPIKYDSLLKLVGAAVNIVWKLGIPVITIAILYSGFLFIQARGNETALKKAKETFLWVIVGAAIILGAFVLAKAIAGTVQSLQAGELRSPALSLVEGPKGPELSRRAVSPESLVEGL